MFRELVRSLGNIFYFVNRTQR